MGRIKLHLPGFYQSSITRYVNGKWLPHIHGVLSAQELLWFLDPDLWGEQNHPAEADTAVPGCVLHMLQEARLKVQIHG